MPPPYPYEQPDMESFLSLLEPTLEPLDKLLPVMPGFTYPLCLEHMEERDGPTDEFWRHWVQWMEWSCEHGYKTWSKRGKLVQLVLEHPMPLIRN